MTCDNGDARECELDSITPIKRTFSESIPNARKIDFTDGEESTSKKKVVVKIEKDA